MRAALFAAALLLSACGGQTAENTDTAVLGNDAMVVDNMAMDNMAMTGPAMNGAAGNMAMGAGTVTVTVNGVQANGGPVLVALQREGDFAESAAAYSTRVNPTGQSVTATISGVEPGTYAAAVVQDTDNNGTFTIGERGPSEPFGFSGQRQTGAPAFGPASFNVAAEGGTATVTLSGGGAR